MFTNLRLALAEWFLNMAYYSIPKNHASKKAVPAAILTYIQQQREAKTANRPNPDLLDRHPRVR